MKIGCDEIYGSCLLYLLEACQALEGLRKHQGEPQVGQPWAMPSYENFGRRVGRLM